LILSRPYTTKIITPAILIAIYFYYIYISMIKPHLHKVLFSVLFITSMLVARAQDKITFIAPDRLLVTGDLYFVNDTLPYMILCHDAKSSRGEYKEIAHRFNKLGYNCIAIDLRVGGTSNGIENETVEMANVKHMSPKLIDSKIDIIGAINYAFERSNKKIVLVGAGYSAALAMCVGFTDPRINCVFAFSPADYYNGALDTKSVFPKCTIPVFVASSLTDAASTKAYVAGIPSSKLTLFAPSGGNAHGTDGLLKSSESNHDYWLSILMYIHQIQGGGQ